jgi:hypothetical protein
MVTDYNSSDNNPHVGDDTCGRCRKLLKRGERVSVANIVDRPGNDPMDLGRKGLFLFEEFEFVHVDCHDTMLKHGVKDL